MRRRVALKIIKLGMDTKEVIARFEQERQALAMMDHPNIAKVLDAGATQWGRPYFVMELVRGIKITDYCDQANLPTAERLALFIQVCQAVQHAHQKGIIHRDLKPSNILVTLHDGVPVPKVIDFGVAKATQQQRLTDLTIYTQFQQMIGTPLYMSPEQAEMSGLDIDTRSDIYALGVLLYELLTGRTPFDPETLMKAGLDEIRRIIREEEPPKPSTALQTMAADARASVAQHRQSDGAKMARLLSGELDWIVMKALEKDRTRRYETANGFAEDIRRYLANEPVTAAAPSVAYLFRKFARRHQAPLGFDYFCHPLCRRSLAQPAVPRFATSHFCGDQHGAVGSRSLARWTAPWSHPVRRDATDARTGRVRFGKRSVSMTPSALATCSPIGCSACRYRSVRKTGPCLRRKSMPATGQIFWGEILEVENLVRISPDGKTWRTAGVGIQISKGDWIRTGEHSRATIKSSDRTMIRIDELTTLSPKKDGIEIHDGKIHFFERKRMKIITPSVSGEIGG